MNAVWDASIVLAHFLARNARKGEFARHKVKGKRALELGSGMGLGGLALAMLGEEVLGTDGTFDLCTEECRTRILRCIIVRVP
jgi:predicted nicotinamide N-methyase